MLVRLLCVIANECEPAMVAQTIIHLDMGITMISEDQGKLEQESTKDLGRREGMGRAVHQGQHPKHLRPSPRNHPVELVSRRRAP